MIKTILPKKYQEPLNLEQLILKDQPQTDDTVPMDVCFGGGGPAGLAGAIELARLVKADNENGGSLGEIEIAVLEKAANLGGHNLSGAVVNPVAFKELFPELSISDFPFKGPVNGDDVYLMTEKSQIKIPAPPTMHNKGNYLASICEIVKWLGDKAEGLGINIFTNFPANSLLSEGKKITGIRTTPAGLDRDGHPSGESMPATDITARVTVLAEGTRGPLTQAYQAWQQIAPDSPQIYALGVKELWKVKKAPHHVIHTLGWPLPKDVFGGSFCYPQGPNSIAIGLVAGLDYKNTNLDVHNLLQKMKHHPLFKQYLEGGECIEWGAKTIPEGGYHSLPKKHHGDGILTIGDAVGLVNVPALKGIHYAMMSGILAARTIFKALKSKDCTSEILKSYDEDFKNSYIYSDLKKVRNMRHAFKSGFYSGGFKATLMSLTGGAFPNLKGPFKGDESEVKTVLPVLPALPSEEGLSKVDAVYLSGNKTRDDIPQHLNSSSDITPEVADFYSSLCPAGVYEQQKGQLVINGPNCVDCKATDVLGPRWTPREGGSGPNYQNM